MSKYKIVIIWWTSNFWKLWVKYFKSKNLEVIIATNSTKLKPIDAVLLWDIIIVSVPIRHTVSVIKEIIPFISKNKLLIDFTWIKIDSSKQVKKYKLWEVVSVHPMFGPWVKTLNKQNISYDPIKAWKKWDFISNLFINDWVNLIKLESRKHDEIVSIVQSSVHIMNLLLWHILKKRWINLNEITKISTPNSRMQLFILSRFLNQNASLYTDMQMYNTLYKNEILPDIKEYFDLVLDLVNNKKTKEFEKEFNEIKDYIWDDFITKAFKITQKIDNELKK